MSNEEKVEDVASNLTSLEFGGGSTVVLPNSN